MNDAPSSHSCTQLPEGYGEILNVNLQKDKKTAVYINGAAAVIMIVMAAAAHFIVAPVTVLLDFDAEIKLFMARMIAIMAGYAVYIVLHELTHGAVMKFYGARKVRFGMTSLYAYAGSEADYFDRHAYIRIALAPLVLWGVIFAVLCAVVPVGWFWVVYFWQIGNVAGAAGDLYVTFRFFRLPSDILVKDTGIEMFVYSRQK